MAKKNVGWTKTMYGRGKRLPVFNYCFFVPLYYTHGHLILCSDENIFLSRICVHKWVGRVFVSCLNLVGK